MTAARIDEADLVLAAMLVKSSDDAIYGTTISGVVISWSPAAQRLFGYETEEMVGRNVSSLVPADRLDELQAILRRVAEGAGAQHYETKRINKHRGLIDVAMTVSCLRDSAGTIVGASAVARNITERKRADAVTAELAAIVDSCNDAIIGKTLDGVITTWNRGAEHIYGYTALEVVGRNVSLLLPPERPGEDVGMIAGMLSADARTPHFETQRIGKDGRPIDVLLTVSPIRDSYGTIIGASSMARDITEQKAMTADLKASVVAVSRAKDEMISLVSHELRTPLASLLGFTELLYSRVLPEEKRKLYLGTMLQEGRRLSDLINDVLHLQRLDAGHQDLNLAPADVEALILRAVEAAGEDTLRPIGVQMPVSLPLVMADTDAVLQVLVNFLSNARKYSPEGGSILVTAQLVGGMVEINVQDHGLGLPADSLTKLFAMFYRVDSDDRRLITGTGLGLAISRKIVEAHGGRVEAHSEGLGRGSRFMFSVPAVIQRPQPADVLIVEDHPDFARLLQEQFGAGGLTAVRTADAETAQRLLKEGMHPRAVITELVLPGLQGEEFVAKLSADGAGEVPVLVLTAKNLAPDEILALEKVGATAVLSKDAAASQAAVSLITRALVPKVAGEASGMAGEDPTTC